MGYIYVIENQINHKKYVGQTIDPKKRWRKHLTDDIHVPSLVLGRAFLKYGIDNFTMTILEECDDSKMSEREQFWIRELNTCVKDAGSHGYNMTRGGEAMYGDSNPFYGCHHSQKAKETFSRLAKQRTGSKNPFFGRHHTEETKQKIRENNSWWRPNADQRKRMSESRQGEKNHFFGKTHSEEAKEKMRQSRLGKMLSEETKAKLRQKSTGRRHSEEVKEKIRKANLGRIPAKAVPYVAFNDTAYIYFESGGMILKWLKENGLVEPTFTYAKLKYRLQKSVAQHEMFMNYYWRKSVETIPDECKEVGLETGTSPKCAASDKSDEEIVHTNRNIG